MSSMSVQLAPKTISRSTISWRPGKRLSLKEYWSVLCKDGLLIICAPQDLILLRVCEWERPHNLSFLSCRLTTGLCLCKTQETWPGHGGSCWSLTSIHSESQLIYRMRNQSMCEGPAGPLRITLGSGHWKSKSNLNLQEGPKLYKIPVMSWENTVLVPSSLQVFRNPMQAGWEATP